MKLTKVRITEFQSIQDSTEFEIDDVTCLVGKNEAGKTSLLKAMYRLNPIVASDGKFDVTDDYPRQRVTEYEDDITAKRRDPAQVVQATYALDPDDITAVKKIFGPECFEEEKPTVTLQKGYSNARIFYGLKINEAESLKALVRATRLPEPLATELPKLTTAKEIIEALAKTGQTESSKKLEPMLQDISNNNVRHFVYNQILRERLPKFLYFDE